MSMVQWDNQKASKPELPGSTREISCVSLVFIKNLINDKSKHNKKMLLFVLYCPSSSRHSYL